uniref:Uncharacterized protein n=1 Tax=Oryza rufipogon TaxID=4529 RepID=A0A0E0QXK9_ORYRU
MWKAQRFDLALAVVAIHLVDDLSNAKQETRTRLGLPRSEVKLITSNLAVGDGLEWDGAAQAQACVGGATQRREAHTQARVGGNHHDNASATTMTSTPSSDLNRTTREGYTGSALVLLVAAHRESGRERGTRKERSKKKKRGKNTYVFWAHWQ